MARQRDVTRLALASRFYDWYWWPEAMNELMELSYGIEGSEEAEGSKKKAPIDAGKYFTRKYNQDEATTDDPES